MITLTDALISLGNAVFVLGIYWWRPKGFSKEQSLGLAIAMLAGGFLFAKLSYGYFNNLEYLDFKNILKYTQGGYSVKGAVLGAFLTAFFYGKIFKLPFTAITRLTVPIWCLAHATWRAGCVAAGCCYGATTKSSFCIYLNKITHGKGPLNSLPLPQFEIILLLLCFLFLGPLRPRLVQDKYLLIVFLLVYYGFAAGVSFLK